MRRISELLIFLARRAEQLLSHALPSFFDAFFSAEFTADHTAK
jgi:hypothetical protein